MRRAERPPAWRDRLDATLGGNSRNSPNHSQGLRVSEPELASDLQLPGHTLTRFQRPCMNPLPEHHFTPQQSAAFQSILNCLQFHPRVLLTAGDGMGRTALIEALHARLEENIVFPMSDDPLARELQLQPKRGVLLAGPPGTGKTSIGRALAHRLGGKFFLVDGTAISGTEYFYHHVDRIFRMAVHNAPAVIFIDDSDVIFESGREHGLYRYLLTKLDGLESKSAGRVCVMLTAMDVGNIPPALVRSGRIELWLEMRLPDAAARETILRRAMAGTDLFDGVDLTQVVARSEEFSGADLKRLVLDAKIRYAAEVQGDRTPPPAETLLSDAADVIRRNRLTYSEAEAKAKARRPDRPLWFSPMSDFHQVVAE